jgi:acyl-CoA thioester hydrolase
VPFEFKLTRRVEFAETDGMGLVHFSNFFRYMESAEHAFIRSLGSSVHTRDESGLLGFPRVQATCDYKSPLRFEDLFEVHLLVREKRDKSLSYTHLFRRLTDQGPIEVARGQITCVCVRVASGQPLKAVSLPSLLADQIQVAPPEMLA